MLGNAHRTEKVRFALPRLHFASHGIYGAALIKVIDTFNSLLKHTMQSYFSKSYVQLLVSLVLLCGILALGSYAFYTLKMAKQGMMGPTTISMTGQGEVFAKPDVGQFTFSVRGEGKDAAEAQTKSAEAINGIMSYLKEQGIEDRDIKTQGYSLNPRYTYEARPCPMNSYCPPGEQVADGFEVNQTISVKVRDLEKAGELIGGAGEHGATDLSGLTFTIDDETALKAEARTAAIAQAREKAKQTARDLNVRIVRMVSYNEQEATPMPYYAAGNAMMESAVAKDVMMAPSLPAGENTITSNVTVVYEIR